MSPSTLIYNANGIYCTNPKIKKNYLTGYLALNVSIAVCQWTKHRPNRHLSSYDNNSPETTNARE